MGEILKKASWSDRVSSYGHWRTLDGPSVDLVLERDDGCDVGFEVTASGSVPGMDFEGLRKLRTLLGDQFLGGIV